MRKILICIYIILIFLLKIDYSFGAKDLKAISKKEGYLLYKEQIKEFCKEYKEPIPTEKPVELIYTLDETSYFVDLGERRDGGYIKEAIDQYKENMDGLYNCATSLGTKRHLLLIKEELIKKSPELKARIGAKIDKLIKKLELKVKGLKGDCKIQTDKKDIQIKKALLNQTTYEFCKYNFYQRYMLWQSENYLESHKGDSIETINNRALERQTMIIEEDKNSTIATSFIFIAYSDYEDNIGTHLLLELIKEDLKVIRDLLHKTLNPINQVIYKISNAMKY